MGLQDIHNAVKPDEAELVRRDYTANEGWETFLAYEDPRQDILIGLLRLRKAAGREGHAHVCGRGRGGGRGEGGDLSAGGGCGRALAWDPSAVLEGVAPALTTVPGVDQVCDTTGAAVSFLGRPKLHDHPVRPTLVRPELQAHPVRPGSATGTHRCAPPLLQRCWCSSFVFPRFSPPLCHWPVLRGELLALTSLLFSRLSSPLFTGRCVGW